MSGGSSLVGRWFGGRSTSGVAALLDAVSGAVCAEENENENENEKEKEKKKEVEDASFGCI